jgi:HEAT repeat protein
LSTLADAVATLGDLDARPAAIAVIDAAGADAVPALRDGLGHPYWRVRHMSARLLDDLPLDADTVTALLEVAGSDPHRKVRAQAYHAAGCEACKPDDAPLCQFDSMAMVQQMLQDRSLRVRRGAATGLLIEAVVGDAADPRLVPTIRALAADPDPTIAKRTRLALEQLALRGRASAVS